MACIGPSTSSAAPGFTLIETLLAMVIAVLLAALLYSTYHTVSTVAAGQSRRQRGRDATARILDSLIPDLGRAVMPGGDDACAFILDQAPDLPPGFSELSFCQLAPWPDETDLRWSEVQRVRYAAVEPGDHSVTLVREYQPVAGDQMLAPTQTNILARQVTRFAVQLYDGENWQDSWPGPSAESEPRAARIEIQTAELAQPVEVELFISAGSILTSAVTRTEDSVHP